MGRAQYTEPVTRDITLGDGNEVLQPLANVQVTVYKLNADGTEPALPANLFDARTGNTPFAGGNPFVTPVGGKTNFFADGGAYRLHFHDLNVPVRIGDQTLDWDVVSGIDSGISASQLPHLGQQLVPAGCMLPYGGAVEPAGWLFCDGRLVNRADYPELFTNISTNYNTAGNEPATQFRLPDYRGRTFVFADGMGTQGAAGRLPNSNRAIGQVGGEERHVMTQAEMPSHSHGVTDPGHIHPPIGGLGALYHSGTATGLFVRNTVDLDNRQIAFDGTIPSATTGISINSAGSGNAHNIMQPYQVSHVIIKAH